jgi:hypothetical protein
VSAKNLNDNYFNEACDQPRSAANIERELLSASLRINLIATVNRSRMEYSFEGRGIDY